MTPSEFRALCNQLVERVCASAKVLRVDHAVSVYNSEVTFSIQVRLSNQPDVLPDVEVNIR